MDTITKITYVLGRLMVHYSKDIWNRVYYGSPEERMEIPKLIFQAFSDYFSLPQTQLLDLPLEQIDACLDSYTPGAVGNLQLPWVREIRVSPGLEYLSEGVSAPMGDGYGPNDA